ncbi:MAG: ClbS/DfsB family four-helix bundle protein [Actinomycetota bacterium]
MGRPTNRAELLDAAAAEYRRLLEVVDGLPADRREVPGACDRWSVKDLLAHLDAWHELFLGWESVGARGGRSEMPAPGVRWSETPELNARIHEQTADDPWDDVVARLDDSHRRVIAVIGGYDEAYLFTKRRFAWTGSTSVGSYAVSATSSHYAWASKLIRRWIRAGHPDPVALPQ